MDKLTANEYGKLCRRAFLNQIKKDLGEFKIKGLWFISLNDKREILTLYSKKHATGWYYGIKNHDWENWSSNKFIALLMREENVCSYVLINPEESFNLISKLNITSERYKQIHVTIPSTGKIRIQEWPELAFENRIKEIKNILDHIELSFDIDI